MDVPEMRREVQTAHPAGRSDLLGVLGYAAPALGSGFFYIPMWSILPQLYAKYFGIGLTTLAACILTIRIFDGFLDLSVGYLSDKHRGAGGSCRPWVVLGSCAAVLACYNLYLPPPKVTALYYLGWSAAYFVAFATTEIPHTTWGNELAKNYQHRAYIFAVRNVMQKIGISAFYALPMLPSFRTSDYTPEVLHYAVYIGGAMTCLGVLWALIAAPLGHAYRATQPESLNRLVASLIHNRPLLLYVAAFACGGVCYGMWFGLIYLYLDSYLQLGSHVALMFFVGGIVGTVFAPLWPMLIRATSKATAWALCVVLFAAHLGVLWFVTPVSRLWIPFLLVVVANICFSCHDVATLSILGDIVDYGKLKFGSDRGSTYVAVNTLIFKVCLGLGAGSAVAIAGVFGVDVARPVSDAHALLGLKLGAILLPAVFALLGVVLIVRTPIDKRRHTIIKMRLARRLS